MVLVQYGRRRSLPRRILRQLPILLLLAFSLLSIWEYRQFGEVTWITRSFLSVDKLVSEWTGKFNITPAQIAFNQVECKAKEPATKKPQPGFDFSGRVIKVKDGDSIIVRSDGNYFEIRLHGIDAPEWSQPYGKSARRKLGSQVLYKTVSVDNITIDKYNRLVSVIYAGDKNINLEMVQSGNAWWYRQYAGSDNELKQAEDCAKAKKLGLWSSPNAIPPWEWRRKN